MNIIETPLEGLLLIEPRVFSDDRGFFFESFNQRGWREATGLETAFVQDNHSRSIRGALRGLHYQTAPHAQAKLIRVSVGEIFDVAVDLRKGFSTFGKWWGVTISADNFRQLWIPEGFAHGFLALSDVAEVLYKTTDFYSPECERCLMWDDKALGIEWPLSGAAPILSDKDANGESLAELSPTFPGR